MPKPFDYTRLMNDMGKTLGPEEAVRVAEDHILSLFEIGVSADSLAAWRQALRQYRVQHGLERDEATQALFESTSDFLARRDKVVPLRRYS